VVIDARGNAYVGNLGFDFPGGEFALGCIALVTPDGAARKPAESYGEQLTAFDIAADGSLSNRRLRAKTPGDHPDGICLDADAVHHGCRFSTRQLGPGGAANRPGPGHRRGRAWCRLAPGPITNGPRSNRFIWRTNHVEQRIHRRCRRAPPRVVGPMLYGPNPPSPAAPEGSGASAAPSTGIPFRARSWRWARVTSSWRSRRTCERPRREPLPSWK
jgi:hypothetical protein